jgi:hypothetical protein
VEFSASFACLTDAPTRQSFVVGFSVDDERQCCSGAAFERIMPVESRGEGDA